MSNQNSVRYWRERSQYWQQQASLAQADRRAAADAQQQIQDMHAEIQELRARLAGAQNEPPRETNIWQAAPEPGTAPISPVNTDRYPLTIVWNQDQGWCTRVFNLYMPARPRNITFANDFRFTEDDLNRILKAGPPNKVYNFQYAPINIFFEDGSQFEVKDDTTNANSGNGQGSGLPTEDVLPRARTPGVGQRPSVPRGYSTQNPNNFRLREPTGPADNQEVTVGPSMYGTRDRPVLRIMPIRQNRAPPAPQAYVPTSPEVPGPSRGALTARPSAAATAADYGDDNAFRRHVESLQGFSQMIRTHAADMGADNFSLSLSRGASLPLQHLGTYALGDDIAAGIAAAALDDFYYAQGDEDDDDDEEDSEPSDDDDDGRASTLLRPHRRTCAPSKHRYEGFRWSVRLENATPADGARLVDPEPEEIVLLRDEDDRKCQICLEKYEPGEAVAVMRCAFKHRFHGLCIEKWHTESGLTCPMCREEFVWQLRRKEEVLRLVWGDEEEEGRMEIEEVKVKLEEESDEEL
jgi:hypothetical protein